MPRSDIGGFGTPAISQVPQDSLLPSHQRQRFRASKRFHRYTRSIAISRGFFPLQLQFRTLRPDGDDRMPRLQVQCCALPFAGRVAAPHAPNSATIALGLLMQLDSMYTGISMQYSRFIVLSHVFPLTGRKSDVHAFFYPSRLRKHRATSSHAQHFCQSQRFHVKLLEGHLCSCRGCFNVAVTSCPSGTPSA